ncbi:hypothetical protein [Streptomyces kanamyceticus]|uniref:Lipoprotein n=1 Tax=Streptomyces kanamyceticus TaxID=1967 RepID=A0A5J6GDY6_STRKN|nr:hypothetical protein [Streptomyces kanamyceticus]QEU92774.1 hypothetical protein CP970_19310 [Streptomyces kanamyceticus]
MRTYVRSGLGVRRARVGVAAFGLAAALAVTGCSSDSDSGGDGGGKKDRGSSGSSTDDGGSTGGSGSGAEDGSVEGAWVTTAGGKPLALVINGKNASLVGEDVMCSGTAGDEAGSQMINLKCPKGNADRTTGRVDSVDTKTMKVSWEGAGKDQFLRTEGGKLPEGLPTGGMPQS